MKMASSLVCTARQTAICKLVFMLCFTPPRMKTGRSPIVLGAGWDVAFKRGQSDWPAPHIQGLFFTSDTKSPGHKARRRQRLQHPFFAVIARPRGAETITHLKETVSPSLHSGYGFFTTQRLCHRHGEGRSPKQSPLVAQRRRLFRLRLAMTARERQCEERGNLLASWRMTHQPWEARNDGGSKYRVRRDPCRKRTP